jgi:hypothetical protein
MTTMRAIASALMSKGVISRGWNSILTGVALLYVAYLLRGVGDTDSAAPFVAVALGVAGVWMTARGIWSEFRRRRTD